MVNKDEYIFVSASTCLTYSLTVTLTTWKRISSIFSSYRELTSVSNGVVGINRQT